MSKMIRCFAFITLILVSPLLYAGMTEGTYELRTLGGIRQGEVTFSVSPTEYEGKKAQKFTVKTILDGDEKYVNEEEAIVNNAGLVYFKHVVGGGDQKTMTEGTREAGLIQVKRTDGQIRQAFGIPIKGSEVSQYEMELPSSPLFKLAINSRKVVQLISMDEMAVVKAVRLVPEKKRINFDNKEIDVFVANTSIGGKVFQSWFDVKSHKLIYERQPDRILWRLK